MIFREKQITCWEKSNKRVKYWPLDDPIFHFHPPPKIFKNHSPCPLKTLPQSEIEELLRVYTFQGSSRKKAWEVKYF